MRKIRKEQGSTRLRKNDLLKSITTIFTENPQKTYNYKQISNLLEIESDTQRTFINELIYQLREEDILTEISRGKFKLNSR